MTKKLNLQKGFTLIELLIFVAILGILAAVAIPQYAGYQAQAKKNAAVTNHATVVNFVKNTLALCSSGAANAMPGVTCAALDGPAMIADFITNGFKNPYLTTEAAATAISTTAPTTANPGRTSIVGSSSPLISGSTVVVTTATDATAAGLLAETITVE